MKKSMATNTRRTQDMAQQVIDGAKSVGHAPRDFHARCLGITNRHNQISGQRFDRNGTGPLRTTQGIDVALQTDARPLRRNRDDAHKTRERNDEPYRPDDHRSHGQRSFEWK